MADRTMPKLSVQAESGPVFAITPYCSNCRTPVPDLTVDHHVCVPDDKGGFTISTRDEAIAFAATKVNEESTGGSS